VTKEDVKTRVLVTETAKMGFVPAEMDSQVTIVQTDTY